MRLTTSSLTMSPVSTSSVVLRLDSNHIVLELPISCDPRVQVVSVVGEGFGLGVAYRVDQAKARKREERKKRRRDVSSALSFFLEAISLGPPPI